MELIGLRKRKRTNSKSPPCYVSAIIATERLFDESKRNAYYQLTPKKRWYSRLLSRLVPTWSSIDGP